MPQMHIFRLANVCSSLPYIDSLELSARWIVLRKNRRLGRLKWNNLIAPLPNGQSNTQGPHLFNRKWLSSLFYRLVGMLPSKYDVGNIHYKSCILCVCRVIVSIQFVQ